MDSSKIPPKRLRQVCVIANKAAPAGLPSPVNPELVEHLERLLALARSGELVELVGVSRRRTGPAGYHLYTDDLGALPQALMGLSAAVYAYPRPPTPGRR